MDDLRSPALDSYYLFHAARADLLRRLGRDQEAAAAYDVAGFLPRTRPNKPSSTRSMPRSSRQAMTEDKET